MKMKILAKPSNRINYIKLENSQEFIKKFNVNVITEEFLEECKKAAKLFKREDQRSDDNGL